MRPIAQFGEKILYQPLKLSSHPEARMDDKRIEGIFSGIRMRSDEVIGTEGGVVKARTIKRLPEEQKWDKEFLREMLGTPRTPAPAVPGSDHIPAALGRKEGDDKFEDPEIDDERGAGDPERKRAGRKTDK